LLTIKYQAIIADQIQLDMGRMVLAMGSVIEKKPSMIKIHFSMHIPVVVKKKDKWFTASCPILDVISQGDTEEDAKTHLAEALSLFLISCYERGTLDAVLKACGFQPAYQANQGIIAETSEDYIDVPLPFIVDAARTCHA